MRTCDSASKLQRNHLVTEPSHTSSELKTLDYCMKYVYFYVTPLSPAKIQSEIRSKDHLVDTVHKNVKLQSDCQVLCNVRVSECMGFFYCLFKIPNCCNEHSEEELVDGFGNVCDLKKDLLEHTRLFSCLFRVTSDKFAVHHQCLKKG